MIYTGLCFVSMNIRPKYSPMIPSESNCTPPKKSMTMRSVGKPCTGSPKAMVLKNTKHIYKNAVMETMTPNNVDILNGIVE